MHTRRSLEPAELARLPLLRSLMGSIPWSRWFERAGVPMPAGGQRLHFDRPHDWLRSAKVQGSFGWLRAIVAEAPSSCTATMCD